MADIEILGGTKDWLEQDLRITEIENQARCDREFLNEVVRTFENTTSQITILEEQTQRAERRLSESTHKLIEFMARIAELEERALVAVESAESRIQHFEAHMTNVLRSVEERIGTTERWLESVDARTAEQIAAAKDHLERSMGQQIESALEVERAARGGLEESLLEVVEERVAGVEVGVAELVGRVDVAVADVDARLDRVDGRMDGISSAAEGRFGEVAVQIDRVAARFDPVESALEVERAARGGLEESLLEVVEERVAGVEVGVTELQNLVDRRSAALEDRVDAAHERAERVADLVEGTGSELADRLAVIDEQLAANRSSAERLVNQAFDRVEEARLEAYLAVNGVELRLDGVEASDARAEARLDELHRLAGRHAEHTGEADRARAELLGRVDRLDQAVKEAGTLLETFGQSVSEHSAQSTVDREAQLALHQRLERLSTAVAELSTVPIGPTAEEERLQSRVRVLELDLATAVAFAKERS